MTNSKPHNGSCYVHYLRAPTYKCFTTLLAFITALVGCPLLSDLKSDLVLILEITLNITSNIIVYTCWFCLKNLSLSDDTVFIGVSDKLQTDHMTCWVMQRAALPSPSCVSVYNWSALCLLCFLRSPMTVSRGLRLGGPPPLEQSAALVGTLWFLYYPLFLPPIPSCPSPPLPPLPPPSSPLPSRRCAGRHEHSNRAGSHHTWNVLLRYGCWIRVRLLLFSSNRVVYILYT